MALGPPTIQDDDFSTPISRGQSNLRWLALLRPLVWLVPVLTFSIVAAYALRFDGQLPPATARHLPALVLAIVCIKVAALLAMRLTLSCHEFVSFHDAYRLLRASFVATATVAVFDGFFLYDISIPRGVILIDGGLTTLLIGGVLTGRRALRERRELYRKKQKQLTSAPSRSQPTMVARRALLVASPASGELLIRAVRHSHNHHFQVLGILTDVERLQHKEIAGIRVLGRLCDVESCASAQQAETLLLSSGDLTGSQVRDIVSASEKLGIKVCILPDVAKIVSGQIEFKPREVAIEDLLGRPQVEIDQSGLHDWLENKRLLVTGSCGSIGSELVRQLLRFSPAHLTLVDRSENGQFHLGRELQTEVESGKVTIVLADANDLPRMNGIFREYQPQIVFHAAAYKHVPMLEHHPSEGVKNIVGATKVIADLSHSCGVETFVMISTDKAVNPTSVMGCCKRVAELYVQSMSTRSSCKYVTVRFGNVLGSAGSVIPVFCEQIASGGPVTVTHPDMTRYFMTIPEASQLVIQAAAMGKGGEIFVLDMGAPVRIMDLAQDMIRLSGLHLGTDIEIEITGLRPGEKLYEELYGESEQSHRTSHEKILVAYNIAKASQKTIATISKLLQSNGMSRFETCEQLKMIVPEFRGHGTDDMKQPVATSSRAA